MKWWQVYVAAGAGAAVLSAVLTAACRTAAPRLGFIDRPMGEDHKQHGREVPVLGGLAMLMAWLLTVGGGLLVSSLCRGLLSRELATYLPGIQTVIPQLAVLVAGALAVTGLGLADDRRPMNALNKLVGQFCVAGAVACWGVRITLFWQAPLVTWGITTFWILLVINAFNFFDNMDGLAAGTAAIAALLFACAAGIRGQYFVAVLAAVTCGCATGFLVFNRAPASIFMGDSGSHLLGYLLAVIGALTTFYAPLESPTPAPVIIPLLVIGLPLFDLCAVVAIRLHGGRPIYVGDHRHISHRFMRLGLTRAQSVSVVWLLAFATGAGAIALLWLPPAGTIIILLQAAAILAIISLLQFFGRDSTGGTEEAK